jgi:hypothetical protein
MTIKDEWGPVWNAIDSGNTTHWFSAGDGWTDDLAKQVDAKLREIQWPSGCEYQGMQKRTTTVDATTYDPTLGAFG